MKRLSRSLRRRQGATATETVILIVLVAMVVLATIKVLRGTLGNKVEMANTQVAAVSTESSDEQRRRENAKRAKEQQAAGGAKGTAASADGDGASGSGGGESGSALVDAPEKDGLGKAAPGTPGAAPEEGCGGFNPFVIPIVLGMFGLLGYVIMKSQKG